MKSLTLVEFFVFEKHIIEKCLELSGNQKGSYPKLEEYKKVTMFYGNGKNRIPGSINQIVYDQIKDSFPFNNYRGFRFDSDLGRWKFNGKNLYDAVTTYNRWAYNLTGEQIRMAKQEILFSEGYYNAYLYFLGIKCLSSLIDEFPVKELENKIDHVNPSGEKKERPGRKNVINKSLAEIFNTLNKELSFSTWQLYSYNPYRDKTVEAVIKINQLIPETMTAIAELFNPPELFDYQGVMNVKFAFSGLIVFDFVPKEFPDKQLHIKFAVDFHKSREYLLGHLMNFQDRRIESYAVVLKKTEANREKGMLHELDNKEVPPVIMEYLQLMKIGHLKTPKHVYDFESLGRWLKQNGETP